MTEETASNELSEPVHPYVKDGEMGRRVRAMDWSKTPLGAMDRWPQTLRIAVEICLNSRFPMFVWWGPDLINIYNNAYIPVLGKRHPEALARRAPEIWSEIWPVIGPQADLVMTKGEATWNERVRLVMERNGYAEDTWFTWSYSPIHDEAGQVAGLFCACTDETARVKAELELARAELQREALLASEREARSNAERAGRVKDEFLATLSHELRTPLNAILGWSQILRGSSDPADIKEGLTIIERNARVQTQIIEDLLDMSRIISGKVRLDVQRLELAALVEAALATVRPAADAKGIRIRAVLDPLAGPVSGDPNRIQQVFWNLLNNAIKFTGPGGQVQVLLERVNSHLEVSVIDTGEGILPEFLPHVFDRFRQADPSKTRKHGGLGIGLSIVKQLVELHGGAVRAKSGGLGKGSTFTVMLPLTVIHGEPETQQTRQHPESGGKFDSSASCLKLEGVKVLVVDDEPDARALVSRVLEDCDAVVTTAASVDEALQRFKANPPDVLISDIGMPGQDGYALIRQIRAMPVSKGGDIPAVALTAFARVEDRVTAVQSGFNMHMSKPVEPIELVTIVASLVARKRN